jgi:oligoendopeptidase F
MPEHFDPEILRAFAGLVDEFAEIFNRNQEERWPDFAEKEVS